MPKELTKKNFDQTMKETNKPVLIDFYADWCGPCRMVAPIVEQLAAELGDQAVICKVNIDNEPELAQQFSISSIPTFVVMKDNVIVNSFTGLRNKQQLKDIVLSA